MLFSISAYFLLSTILLASLVGILELAVDDSTMVETIQPTALAIVVTLPVLSTIFVALRIGFRSWTNQFKWGECY